MNKNVQISESKDPFIQALIYKGIPVFEGDSISKESDILCYENLGKPGPMELAVKGMNANPTYPWI